MDVSSAEPPRPEKPRRTISLSTFIFSLLVVGTLAFVGGDRYPDLLARFGGSSDPADLDLSSLQTTYDTLRSKYDGELDPAKLVDGAHHGLVDAAGDPYTVYFNAEEAADFASELDGTFQGIGAEIGKKDDRLIVVSTLDGSPAKASGLRAGDVITKVNDEETTGWSIEEAVGKIRGEKGTTVKLSIIRGDELKDISITRDQITNPSVRHEILDGNIGYLRISRFGEGETVALAQKAATEFNQKQVKGVILDLRGNGGGYLDTAQKVTGLWLNNAVVVTERKNGQVTDTLRTGNNATLQGIPTVVLVDGGSASASEIVAGALSDHGAATLVGEQTFGKGSVQTIEDLPGGGQIKVTVARWFTPNGKNINEEGIAPTITVKPSNKDIEANNDVVRQKAIELLKRGL